MTAGRRAAEKIWAKYARRIGQEPVPSDGIRPGTAGGLDKDSFILTVADIIDAEISGMLAQQPQSRQRRGNPKIAALNGELAPRQFPPDMVRLDNFR